ncbi:hypothetical protein AB833_29460 [Chromatiales bacterium (ex Bugula neritina AB1)]|nr:hypothetical protein AB833_29460 [Chromatiales bacterium (ex Bugula neritina AB1)]
MFSYSRLKHRCKRFRYYNEARHPTLFRIYDFALVPSQLFIVAIAVWAVVDLYQSRYSATAHYERYKERHVSGSDSIINSNRHPINSESITKDNTKQIKVAGNKPQPLEITPFDNTTKQLSASVNLSDQSIIERRSPVVITTETNRPAEIQPVPSTDNATANSELPGTKVLDEGWLLQQPHNHFVIQLASSSDIVLLEQYAKDIRIPAPAVIYPFKQANTQNTLYGLSTGNYSSLDQASKAVAALDTELQKFGAWIRQVSTLQQLVGEYSTDLAHQTAASR